MSFDGYALGFTRLFMNKRDGRHTRSTRMRLAAPTRLLTIQDRLRSKTKQALNFTTATAATLGLPLTAVDRKLSSYANAHSGRTAFLIGNGPSVRHADLDAVRGSITFCCNRFYLAYDRLAFRPTYLVSSDAHMIEDFGEEMLARAECPVWLVDEHPPAVAGDFLFVRAKWTTPFRFVRDIRYGASVGGATLVSAVQIGYYLGIRRFILYGVDHRFTFENVPASTDGRTARGEGNHFIADYRSGRTWAPPLKPVIEQAFRTCDAVLRKEGGWIKNATRGGDLEVLERVTFEKALALPRQ